MGAGGPRFESGHPDHHLFIRRHGGFFLPCVKGLFMVLNMLRIMLTGVAWLLDC
jgi:hypothetical protein